MLFAYLTNQCFSLGTCIGIKSYLNHGSTEWLLYNLAFRLFNKGCAITQKAVAHYKGSGVPITIVCVDTKC